MRKIFLLFILISATAFVFFAIYARKGDLRVFSLSAYGNKSLYVSQLSAPPSPVPSADNVKAIHLAYGSYFSNTFEGILKEIKNSQINSVVFEIKDPYGRVAIDYDTHVVLLKKLLPQLKRRGIYTIARIVVFQDPALVKKNSSLGIKNTVTGFSWSDYKGMVWADPTQKEVWKYNTDIASRALKLGFNEVNLDYVRFPTDGSLKQAEYENLDKYGSKQDTISNFLKFARKELGSNAKISADVFGMIFLDDQHTIGQSLGEMIKYIDIIAPMSYPSHYPDGFIGFSNPSKYPYEVVYYTLEKGLEKMDGSNVVVRPWVQDFNLGAVYDEFKIKEQIRAINDFDIDTWMLWNSSNRYTYDAVR